MRRSKASNKGFASLAKKLHPLNRSNPVRGGIRL
jgi:hypothetical protein